MKNRYVNGKPAETGAGAHQEARRPEKDTLAASVGAAGLPAGNVGMRGLDSWTSSDVAGISSAADFIESAARRMPPGDATILCSTCSSPA